MTQVVRITNASEWRHAHAVHLPPGDTFRRELYPHPSGAWVALTCPCGQKYIMLDEDASPSVH